MKRTSWRELMDGASARGRVLVVDDEPQVRTTVSRLLSHVGYSTQSCASAEAADMLLAAERFDVCLLDIELPRMSGVEFLDWAQKRDPEMAVIMLTGVDVPSVALDCIDRGARTFLVKPIEAQFLLRAVRDAVALRRLLVEHNDRHDLEGSTRQGSWHACS